MTSLQLFQSRLRQFGSVLALGVVVSCSNDGSGEPNADGIVRIVVDNHLVTINRYLQARVPVGLYGPDNLQVQRLTGIRLASLDPGLVSPVGIDVDVDQTWIHLVAFGRTGRTTITISDGDLRASFEVTVTQIPAGIRVTPGFVTMAPGTTQQLAAAVIDQHGDSVASAPFSFRSNAAGVFAVSSAGTISAHGSPGSGTLTISRGDLSTLVGVFVGTPVPMTVAQTTTLPNQGYGVAVAASGRLVVTGGDVPVVGFGALPEFALSPDDTLPTLAYGVVINRAGSLAYVAAGSDVRVIEMVTHAVVDTIPTYGGGLKLAVALSADERRLYVGTTTGLAALDRATGTAAGFLTLTAPIYSIALDPLSGKLYATLAGGGVAEALFGDVPTALRLFSVGPRPHAVTVSGDGSELYVVSGDSLQVWSLATGNRSQSVWLGGEGFGVAVGGERIAVTVSGGVVKLFDRRSRVPVDAITVGGNARGVAWNSDATTLIVANGGGWVDFIQ